ncbi:MAG: hypothetical protein M3Z04_21885 [Chloroflexota bacterium]|nr:hypothetical protein [Chloroflexota bacterium]
MTTSLIPGDELLIDGTTYQVVADPAAPDQPLWVAGSTAQIYRLDTDSGPWALKVSPAAQRTPSLVVHTRATATAATAATAAVLALGDPVWVLAQNDWQDVGKYLQGAQLLTITSLGDKWSIDHEYYVTADGAMTIPLDWNDSILKDCRHGAVIGRIGSDSTPFCVGGHYSGQASRSGPLQLRINDRQLSDNKGSLKMAVRLDP